MVSANVRLVVYDAMVSRYVGALVTVRDSFWLMAIVVFVSTLVWI